MRIAICDDEINALNQTSNTVKKVFDEMKLKCTVNEFTNETELLNNKKQYDVVFLDIELNDPNRNGVWVAKMLKKNNPECIIIFITNYEEYIDEVIEKYAFRYWSKPIKEQRLQKSINEILERIKTILIELHDTKRIVELPIRNIVYVTPEHKRCKIVTISDEYIINETFKDFKQKFTARNFCECHGSYYVNLNYVKEYTKSYVLMRYKGKKYEVHMSRRHYKDFKERMFMIGGEKE